MIPYAYLVHPLSTSCTPLVGLIRPMVACGPEGVDRTVREVGMFEPGWPRPNPAPSYPCLLKKKKC